MKPTLRMRLIELRYWHLSRPAAKLANALLAKVPKSIQRRIWYIVTARATTTPELQAREVPSITINEVMSTFPKDGR